MGRDPYPGRCADRCSHRIAEDTSHWRTRRTCHICEQETYTKHTEYRFKMVP